MLKADSNTQSQAILLKYKNVKKPKIGKKHLEKKGDIMQNRMLSAMQNQFLLDNAGNQI